MRIPLVPQGRRERRVESKLVWIFGSPRSGSTWLLSLLAADPAVVAVDEPTVGVHLGVGLPEMVTVRQRAPDPDRFRIADLRADLPSYFFSRRYQESWRPALRGLLLSRFAAEMAAVAKTRRSRPSAVALKEPDGSLAADLIMSLLPRSRMIFLLRDGRDVLDSEVDALSAGGWASRLLPGYEAADQDRLGFLRARAHLWVHRTAAVQRAFDAHDERLRMRIRYEDLLRDTHAVADDVAQWLDLDRAAVAEAVQALSFKRISPEERGRGKFARAATPGLWRENLSDSEQDLLERIAGATLRSVGYD